MAEHLELVAEIPKVEKLTVQERLEYAKKRRAQQIKRWEREKDSDFGPPPRKKKFRTKPLAFEPQFMLLDAATRGDVDEVKSMLENGIDPNICNDDGLTALHQACIDGREEIIDILLDYGAQLDGVDRELWTPLHAATACGNEDIVEYLLDQGANIVAINADGNMPIDLAEDDEELRDILEAEMEEQGFTEEKLMQLKEEEENRMLTDLKNDMAADDDYDLDKKNEQGATLVHIAAANCYEDALEYLLEQGAGVDIPDKDGWQPLHGAAVWGNERTIEMLVDTGADLDAKTPRGETPLSLCEDPELQQFLVDLKNKVKANKTKTARRKRSNSRSLSVKRTSLKDKISISHNEAKAEAILRVHPQLAFLLPKGAEGKEQDQKSKPMDVTPAATEGQATQNSTTANTRSSSLTRPKTDKENIDPVARGDQMVAKDKRNEDTGTAERKSGIKITVKTHTTTIDNTPSEQQQKPRSPRQPPDSPKADVTIATSRDFDNKEPRSSGENQRSSTLTGSPRESKRVAMATARNSDYKEPGRSPLKEAKSSSLSRDRSTMKQSSSPACSLVSITSNTGPKSPSGMAPQGTQSGTSPMKTPQGTQRDTSPIKTPQAGSGAKTDTPSKPGNNVGVSTSFKHCSAENLRDVNSNSKQVGDAKMNSKMISSSSDNIGPRSGSGSGTSSLPKSSKSRHAPPPPIPRSSGSLSRSHEPEDTSGYPDSFSKKSRNSRENILDVLATGRLATPDTKPISAGDIKIESTAGTVKYSPSNQPYSSHNDRGTKQPTKQPINQPTNKPSNQTTKQPTNKHETPSTGRYTKRDSSETISNDKVLYKNHADAEREKKTCCVIM